MILIKTAPAKSSKLLYMVLALTLGLTAWTAMHSGDEQSSNEVVVAKRFDHATSPAQEAPMHDADPATEANLHIVKREASKQAIQELFKVHSWYVSPPIKKAPPAPPPAPVAPPLPFIYNGKLEGTAQGTLIFLVANNVLYTVKKGDNVTPQWRLDMENDSMLRFTYLPLNLPQVLLKSKQMNPAATVALAAQNNS